jgi:hypothetical protein
MHDRLLAQITHEAIEFGLLPDQALLFAHRIAHTLSAPITRSDRNQKIKTEFTGRNHSVLMRKYDISRSTLHRILST